MRFVSDIDIRSGRLNVGVTDRISASDAIRKAALSTDDTDLVEVPTVEKLTAAVYGGSRLDGQNYCDSTICSQEIATTAFTVTNGTTKGVLTAAHVGECANSATTCVKNSSMTDQTGVILTYVNQRNAGGEDYEWRTASNTSNTFANIIRYSTATMTVTATGDPTTYAVGTTVCKQGRTTGYTCGPIQSTNTNINYNGTTGTYVRVKNSATGSMCDTGDSGGPLFVSATALGITHALSTTYPGQCYFMPIQRISSLGLSVVVR